MGNIMNAFIEKKIDIEIDHLYTYLMDNTNIFNNMAMDEQGELMMRLKEILKKYLTLVLR